MWTTYKLGDWWTIQYRLANGSTSKTTICVKNKIDALRLIHYLNGGDLEPSILTRVMLEDEEYQTKLKKQTSDYFNK